VPDDTSREDFKEAFAKYADVSWVDFQRGDTKGEVRFSGPEAANVVAKCVEEEIKINGVVPVLTVVEGEAEEVSSQTQPNIQIPALSLCSCPLHPPLALLSMKRMVPTPVSTGTRLLLFLLPNDDFFILALAKSWNLCRNAQELFMLIFSI
jgi:hypothetical protein